MKKKLRLIYLLVFVLGVIVFMGQKTQTLATSGCSVAKTVKATCNINYGIERYPMTGQFGACTHSSFTNTAYFAGLPVKRVCNTCGQEQVPTYLTAVEGVTSYSTEPLWHGYNDYLGGIDWIKNDAGEVTYYGVWHDTGTEVTISANVGNGYRFSCFTDGSSHTTETSCTITKNSASTWTANVWKNHIWEGLIVGREKSCAVCGDESEWVVWMNTNGYEVTANNPNYSEFEKIENTNYEIYFYPNDTVVSFTAFGEEGYTYFFTESNIEYEDTISFTMNSGKGVVVDRRKNAYTVTYNVNGGVFEDGTSEDKSAVIDFGAEVPLDILCEKEGYHFVGWAESVTDKASLSFLEMPAKDITLYAMYSPPVSDIKEVQLIVWSTSSPEEYKIYPLEKIGTNNRGYTYSLEGIDITEGLSFSSTEEITWRIEIYDNAGNSTTLYPDEKNGPVDPGPVIPKEYIQTVEHLIWNEEIKDWTYHTTTAYLVKEGETFTPEYLETTCEEYPIGYQPYQIDGAYTVTKKSTTYAYYMPKEYHLYFDANGGTCVTASKIVSYNGFYGELPVSDSVFWKGHTFQGWFTLPDGGVKISSTDKYTQTEDSTLFAHWSTNRHNVIYDYWTNGGTSSTSNTKEVAYGSTVDLSPVASKDGYTFVGWNRDADATTKETTITMGDEPVVLYAVYRKDMTVTYVDGEKGTSFKENISVYNRQESKEILIPKQTEVLDWNAIGWSRETKADAAVEVTAGTVYELRQDVIFYGCYEKELYLYYDTNGSAQTFEPQSGTRYFNAFGNYNNPEFIITEGPILDNHTFVNWSISGGPVEEESGVQLTNCVPGNIVILLADATLKATWDQYPEIEAYNRYFTLEEAKTGKITEERLLEKVSSVDLEDGILRNGVDVIVKDYDTFVFINMTADAEVEVAYQATDSFGNTVTKTVSIWVTDTTARRSNTKKYVRFISRDFFVDDRGNLITLEQGGLEKTSIWRKDLNYYHLLYDLFFNKKDEVETCFFTYKDICDMKLNAFD